MESPVSTSQLSVGGSLLNSSLMDLLMCESIQPGSEPSYAICKTLYCDHPLGAKMAEAPISMAQSQMRDITIQDSPDEVIEEFNTEWRSILADSSIHNLMRLSRVYGLSVLVMGCKEVAADKPLDMTKIWQQSLFFNVLDPLNTAGSLVLSQIPTSPDFNKPVSVRTNGVEYHPSRFQVMMNEEPVYLQYTGSAFGFVGRSVYQRALYPLKSFIRSMIADDLISTKLALLVAKQKAPGSVITQTMAAIAGIKRNLLRQAQTGNVLSIDVTEDITTLNMQNVDGAGTYSRTNILKNIATAADMPAKLLENETMVAGFGEGTEDAKNIARYIERIRMKMNPVYAWFDNIVQYRAWNPDFYARMQKKYPDRYGKTEYADAFSEWRRNFAVEWPSLLIEPDSEKTKSEKIKLESVISVMQTLLPELDATNKALLIQSALANIGENKQMFAHEFQLDYDELLAHLQTQQDTAQKTAESQANPDMGEKTGPEAAKVGRFG